MPTSEATTNTEIAKEAKKTATESKEDEERGNEIFCKFCGITEEIWTVFDFLLLESGMGLRKKRILLGDLDGLLIRVRFDGRLDFLEKDWKNESAADEETVKAEEVQEDTAAAAPAIGGSTARWSRGSSRQEGRKAKSC